MINPARRPAPGTSRAGWRRLGRFWMVVLAVLGAVGGALQWLGPPPAAVAPAEVPAPSPAATLRTTPLPGQPVATPAAVPTGPSPALPRLVSAPDPALSVPMPGDPGHVLPRIGPDGRTPMAVYAAAFNFADPRPRVGLILAGIGLDQAASLAAIRTLPAGITLAVSPYATDPDPLLATARDAGHEFLVSIPMEPEGFPLNDPGDHALLTRQTPAQNRRALDWALSRFAGYVGATGALGQMRGQRFAGSPEDMNPVLRQLGRRGLLYIDPRPHAPRQKFVRGRDVDVVIDDPGDAAAIDAALTRLDAIAQRRGRALGLVGAVRPAVVARLAAWAHELAAQGLVLAPVTALMPPPIGARGGRPKQ